MKPGDRRFREWFVPDKDYQISTGGAAESSSSITFATNKDANISGVYTYLDLWVWWNRFKNPYLDLYCYLPSHTEDDGIYNFNIFNFYEGRED